VFFVKILKIAMWKMEGSSKVWRHVLGGEWMVVSKSMLKMPSVSVFHFGQRRKPAWSFGHTRLPNINTELPHEEGLEYKDICLHWGWWPEHLKNMMFGCWVVNTQVGFTLWVVPHLGLVAAAMPALARTNASLIDSD
jgi:hypothetical protein